MKRVRNCIRFKVKRFFTHKKEMKIYYSRVEPLHSWKTTRRGREGKEEGEGEKGEELKYKTLTFPLVLFHKNMTQPLG